MIFRFQNIKKWFKSVQFLSGIHFMGNFWKKIPEQIRRLSLLIIILIVVFLIVRALLVPEDFGEYGHYRASSLKEIAAQDIHYAGHEVCGECHDDVREMKETGYHKNVACEVCHGAGATHTEAPDEVRLQAPQGRGYCPLCHEYLPSRPTGFPQIVTASHNPMKPCITCHDPHDPKPPVPPKECDACHAEIARTKSLSHHVYVPCTRCHQAPEEHKVQPRLFLPRKPEGREFCGGCHATEEPEFKGVPQIDLETHNPRYVCWQCHYPHLPEAQ
ncbi:MAG: hypothetical protein Kow0042_05660 [Calditrichia bacterium]